MNSALAACQTTRVRTILTAVRASSQQSPRHAERDCRHALWQAGAARAPHDAAARRRRRRTVSSSTASRTLLPMAPADTISPPSRTRVHSAVAGDPGRMRPGGQSRPGAPHSGWRSRVDLTDLVEGVDAICRCDGTFDDLRRRGFETRLWCAHARTLTTRPERDLIGPWAIA